MSTFQISTLTLPDTSTIFYRTAGSPTCPTLLLLHGYPSSSHQYRNLIPLLSPHYHIIAPDLPGFGFTTVPSNYVYTFENLTNTLQTFIRALSITNFTIYIFDYGAPVGLRLALQMPSAITAIISQNGNAYEEGLGAAWAPIRSYWADKTPEKGDELKSTLMVFNTTKWQYESGNTEETVAKIQPEGYWLDQTLMDRPGNKDIQLALFYDYQNNVGLYPKFQEYFRERQPPLLAVWGKNDAFFVPPGAEAFKRDLPRAVVRFVDAGHFALETRLEEIADEVKEFLGEVVGRK
jgi:pimeloyl-ACP methyl ester carboxylesterase